LLITNKFRILVTKYIHRIMDRGKRLQKSEAARTKRDKVKETLETIEKRKRADIRNNKKKLQKIKKRHHNE